MAFNVERPDSFGDALKLSKKLLSYKPRSHQKRRDGSGSRADFQAALRQATGVTICAHGVFQSIDGSISRGCGRKSHRDVLVASSRQVAPTRFRSPSFLDHEYEVGPDVLVPRPETELLVQQSSTIIPEISRMPRRGVRIGIGSGAISSRDSRAGSWSCHDRSSQSDSQGGSPSELEMRSGF